MNQRTKAKPAPIKQQAPRGFLADAAPAIAGIISAVLAYVFQKQLFGDLNNYPLTIVLFLWLFGTMMWCAFGVVRHAEAFAEKLGEPYGTLVLTLSVIVIEVALLASIMLHGENNPTLARDAMFATLMIVLNGMVGAALRDGRAALLGAGIQSRRRARLSRRDRLAGGVRADHCRTTPRPSPTRASRRTRR